MTAAQDGVTAKRSYWQQILGEDIDTKCRMCGENRETLGHILSAYPLYKFTLYKERHDRVLYQLARSVLLGLWEKLPESLSRLGGICVSAVVGTPRHRMLIDMAIPTLRTVEHRRPDLVVYLQERKEVLLLKVACAWDPLIQDREKQKRGKYSELAADLAKQKPGYHISIIPVVFGDLGVVGVLKTHLARTKVLKAMEMEDFIARAQREVLCAATKIIKRHMAADSLY